MTAEWTIVDHSNGRNAGYWRIMRGNVRVADVFPYAHEADAAWLWEQTKQIVDVMNQRRHTPPDAQGRKG